MSSTQHQLIEQCAIRLRGIVEALDNIHDSTQHRSPHRWSTDLDDVHSSAESLLSLIKDQAPTQAAQGLAGAALAQPSPVRSSLLINGYQLRAALDFIAPDGTAEQLKSEACIEWRQQDADFLEAGLYAFCAEYPEEGGVLLDEEPTTAQPSPLQSEQAEAERPEVVARVVHSNPVVLGQCGPLNANDELMTVAQHAASVARWAEMFNRVEQERDAALARVAELETALEPFAAVADAYDDSEDDDHEPYTDMGCDDRLRLTLGQHRAGRIALEGRTPQAQAQHSVPEGLAEFSQFLSAVMDAAGLVRYGRRSKELSEYLGAQCMKYRLSAPVAQAQHSGPEEFSFEYRHPNGESHTVTVSRDQVISEMPDFLLEALCSKFCNCEPVGETNVVECCCDEYAEEFKLLAAAPGKEVPQAWLDVQAERRRQVEVEGYHGFRDNHYISYELSKAARAYIEVSWHALSGGLPCKKPESWPWMAGFKWSDGRTMLVKACALALAEIERLDRAAATQGGPSDA
ncbi:TPA: hypothetical protein ACU6EY_002567 [Pseudomonas aeruginosa]